MAGGSKKRRRPLTRNELLSRNPVWRANLGTPVPGHKRTELALRARLAFDNIVNGRTGYTDPDDLAVVSNVCLVLCERDVGGASQYTERVKQAQQAILHAQERENEGAAFDFTEPERHAILDLMDLHEQLVALASELQMIEALAEVDARIRRGDVERLDRKTTG